MTESLVAGLTNSFWFLCFGGDTVYGQQTAT